MIITLAGVIGAGKSTLTEKLATELGTKPFYEPVADNPVLPLFYKDPDKYALLLQIYFLNKRFKAIKQAYKEDNNILDRSIFEDAIFFHMNADMGRATETEVAVYDELLDNMMEEMEGMPKKAPDLMVLIKVSYETMLKRIKKRGREYEQIENDGTLEEYYKRLISYYDKWERDFNVCPLLVIDGDKYDFVENDEDQRTVISQIKNKLHEIGSL